MARKKTIGAATPCARCAEAPATHDTLVETLKLCDGCYGALVAGPKPTTDEERASFVADAPGSVFGTVACPNCDGEEDRDDHDCRGCDGFGIVVCEHTPRCTDASTHKCARCDGTGVEREDYRCLDCDNTGRAPRRFDPTGYAEANPPTLPMGEGRVAA